MCNILGTCHLLEVAGGLVQMGGEGRVIKFYAAKEGEGQLKLIFKLGFAGRAISFLANIAVHLK